MITKKWLGAPLIITAICWALAADALTVRMASAPEDDLDLAISAIKSAKHSLYFNAYELTSEVITDSLIDRIKAGVKVTILQEGQPVGNITSNSKKAQVKILQAMQSHSGNHYFLMAKQTEKKRRFRFDHAKYIVIDESNLLIGSENYTDSGHPPLGVIGNRGWEVLLGEDVIVREYLKLFNNDINVKFGDIKEINDEKSVLKFDLSAILLKNFIFQNTPGVEMAGTENKTQISHSRIAEVSSVGLSSFEEVEAKSAQSIISPATSLSGLTELLGSAKSTLDIQMMTFSLTWDTPASQSPLFQSVVQAARRGVRVRVLLNDERAFDPGVSLENTKNFKTVSMFNSLAKSEKLPIEGRIANVKAMGVGYIHNKGALIDQDKTLISSINWNLNSVTNNREAAVVITSERVHGHYLEIFERDWESSQDRARYLPSSNFTLAEAWYGS